MTQRCGPQSAAVSRGLVSALTQHEIDQSAVQRRPGLIYKEHPSRMDILRARKAAEAEHDSAQPDDEAAK
jgi:hypothetical protein